MNQLRKGQTTETPVQAESGVVLNDGEARNLAPIDNAQSGYIAANLLENPFHRRFELLESERIGQGRSWDVFRGFDHDRRTAIAIKRLRAGIADRDEWLHRIQTSARFPAHPHLASILAIEETNGLVAMRLFEGSLANPGQSRTLDPELVPGILRDALLGLGAIHAQEQLHAALKPENLLRGESGRFQLSDARGVPWGLPVTVNAEDVKHAAPEWLLPSGGNDITAAGDLYALATVILRALLGMRYGRVTQGGRVAFGNGEVDWRTWHLAWDKEYPPLSQLAPALEPATARLLDRMLCKVPSERPVSVVEALHDLKVSSQNGNETAPPVAWATTSTRELAQEFDPAPRLSKPPEAFRGEASTLPTAVQTATGDVQAPGSTLTNRFRRSMTITGQRPEPGQSIRVVSGTRGQVRGNSAEIPRSTAINWQAALQIGMRGVRRREVQAFLGVAVVAAAFLLPRFVAPRTVPVDVRVRTIPGAVVAVYDESGLQVDEEVAVAVAGAATDNIPLGLAEVHLADGAGQYAFQARLSGYEDVEQLLEIPNGDGPTELPLPLIKKRVSLPQRKLPLTQFIVSPSDAKIVVRDTQGGMTPPLNPRPDIEPQSILKWKGKTGQDVDPINDGMVHEARLDSGHSYAVTVSREGYERQERIVLVNPSQRSELQRFTLRQLREVFVLIEPREAAIDAEVLLNGKPMAKLTGDKGIRRFRSELPLTAKTLDFFVESTNFEIPGEDELQVESQELEQVEAWPLVRRIRMVRVEPAYFALESQPPGAAIFVDGADLQLETPARVPLKYGTYLIELRLPGFEPWKQHLRFDDGNTNYLANLERAVLQGPSNRPPYIMRSTAQLAAP